MPVAYSIRWEKPHKSRGDLRVNESRGRDQDESQKWREVAEVERASEVTGFSEGKGDKRVVGGTQVRAQERLRHGQSRRSPGRRELFRPTWFSLGGCVPAEPSSVSPGEWILAED